MTPNTSPALMQTPEDDPMTTPQAVSHMPDIPTLRLITERPQPLSRETRIEYLTGIIAEVLHNGYTLHIGVPAKPWAQVEPAVRKVYEGLARLAVMPLLDPERLKQAEAHAVYRATDLIGQYMDEDTQDDGVPADVWNKRLEKATKLALAEYSRKVMGL